MLTQSFRFEIKALDDGERLVEGWATRPEVDRTGDIVMPKGVQYKLPLPFLLDHDHEKAIGDVEKVFVSDQGIRFIARIKKINSDSNVARACDNAWDLIRNGLRRYVSIGFRVLKYEIDSNTGGMIVNEWEWLELSAVTIPALGSAEITGFKKFGVIDRQPSIALLSDEELVSEHFRKGAVKLQPCNSSAVSDATPRKNCVQLL